MQWRVDVHNSNRAAYKDESKGQLVVVLMPSLLASVPIGFREPTAVVELAVEQAGSQQVSTVDVVPDVFTFRCV